MLTGSCHYNSIQLPDFDCVLYLGTRRRICTDIIERWGSCGQLCPPLLHPGCQSGLLPSSRNLHHSALHLSAWLLSKLHTQPISQNTQVGSSSFILLFESVTAASSMIILSLPGRIRDMCLFQESGEKPRETRESHSGGLYAVVVIMIIQQHME